MRWLPLIVLVSCGHEAPTADPCGEAATALLDDPQAFRRRIEMLAPADADGWRTAEATARDATACRPDDASGWALLGQILQARAPRGVDHDPAIPGAIAAAYVRAIALAPEDRRLRERLVEHHLGRGEYAAARPHAEALVALSPGETHAALLLAKDLLMLGELAQAEATLGPLLEAPASDPLTAVQVRELLGRLRLRQGRLAEAEQVLVESSTLLLDSPTLDQHYYGCPFQALGQLYTVAGQDDLAAASFAFAATLEDGNVRSQLEAALTARAAGDMEAYEHFVARAEQLQGRPLSPDMLQVEHGIAQILSESGLSAAGSSAAGFQATDRALLELAASSFEEHRFSSAAKYAAAVSEGAPERSVVLGFVALMRDERDNARAHFEAAGGVDGATVGRAHLALGAHDTAEARAALGPLADAPAPRDGRRLDAMIWRLANLGMAWAAANQAEHEQAIDYYDRVLVTAPEDAFALLGKGNALASLARPDEAEPLFRRVLARNPDDPFARAEMGLLQYNRGELEAAQRSFEHALEAGARGNTCPHEGLGLVYLRQGRIEDAERAFGQAIELDPDIEYKKYNGLAAIYIEQGRLEEARALLLKSIENYPYDSEAARLLAEIEGR